MAPGVPLRHQANERRSVRALWSIALLLAAQFGIYSITAPANAAESDTVFARGTAAYLGSPYFPPDHPTVDIASSPSGNGYYVLNSGGGLTPKGDAAYYGSMGGAPLNQPMVAMAVVPAGTGYAMLSKDGGLFNFGSAQYFGSTSSTGLEAVDIVYTPSGNGYWILLANGEVRHFGGAADLADIAGTASRPVGLARSATGNGYWILTENGGITAIGDAPGFGDAAASGKSFAAIAARPDGTGYWAVAKDGTIYDFGAAAAFAAITSTFPIAAAAAHPGGTGLWAASSAVAPPGAIQGVVKNTEGAGVGGICVTASTSYFPGGTATTSPTGFYRIENVKPGSYKVHFKDCDGDTYYPQFFNGADTEAAAAPVTVQSGKTTFKIGATMAPGGFVSGGVHDEMGEPVFSCVGVFDLHTGISDFATTVTGNYKAGPLKPGSYKVNFTSCGDHRYIGQSWPAAESHRYGHEIAVTAGGHVRNISGVLRNPGAITGVVSAEGGGPLSNVCVEARFPGEENRSGEEIHYTTSSITGFYRLTGLRTGAYAVQFRDCGGRGYAEEYFHDAMTEAEADAVQVVTGQTTTDINEALAPGAVISGSVQTADGPVTTACVSAWQDGRQFASATAYSSVTGWYRIAGLQQGTYKVFFDRCFGNDDYAPEWWQDSATRAGATPLTLAPNQEASEINGTMSGPSSSISGVVTSPNGAPAQGACVMAKDGGGLTKAAFTSVTGYYRIGGLSAQAYKVRFEPCSSGPGAGEWFNNKANEVAANPVTTSAGANTPNINARFDAAGSISGVVSATGGELASSCLTVTDTAGNVVRDALTTSMTGFYKITGLHGGFYKLHFGECDPGPFEKEWWDDADSVATADVIGVTAGANTTANAELALESANAPTGVMAGARNSSAAVSWSPPSYTGTSPTTSYEVSAWAGGFPVRTVTVPAGQTSTIVTGLQNGKQYRFRVAARNAGGLGRQSVLSNAVTPALTASIQTPGATTDPAVITFSDVVKGVTTGNVVIRVTGTGSNLPASVVCKNQGGTVVSCATGQVRTATLQPTSALTASESYTVVVNPAGTPPVRDFAGNVVTRVSATFVAGAAAASVART